MFRGNNLAKIYTDKILKERELDRLLNPKEQSNTIIRTTKEKLIVSVIVLILVLLMLYLIYNTITVLRK